MKTVRRMTIISLDLLTIFCYFVIFCYCITKNFEISAHFGVVAGIIQGIRFIVRHIDEIRKDK